MNRFDRVVAILLLLQTKPIVTAGFLASRFSVSVRTIYRDIRSLEQAGVPIGSEVGVGYFLDKAYRLPPVRFSLDEAAALLLGEKLVSRSFDQASLSDFNSALSKIRAVVSEKDKRYLCQLDEETEVLPSSSHFPIENLSELASNQGMWLAECRSAVVYRQVLLVTYQSRSQAKAVSREIDPIGLFYYNWHWHVIAWCRLRQAYRDFRLDRFVNIAPTNERFNKQDRLTLQQFLQQRVANSNLLEVELLFGFEAARFVEEQRYMFGFVEEEVLADGVLMRFLTSMPKYMARWLLQYLDDVQVMHGAVVKQLLKLHANKLHEHWLKDGSIMT